MILKTHAFVGAAILATASLTLSAQTADADIAAMLKANPGPYYIQEETKNEVVAAGSNNRILRWVKNGGKEQHWNIVKTASGYQFRNVANNEYITAAAWNGWYWRGAQPETFRLAKNNGKYTFQESTRNEYFTIGGDGGLVRWSWNGTGQRYVFVPVNPTPAETTPPDTTPPPPGPGTSAVTKATGITREAAAGLWNTAFGASVVPADGWTGSTATCNPGTLSAAYVNALLLRTNYYRRMAGVPDLVIDPALQPRAQAAALIQAAVGNLTNHYPAPTAKCYSDLGAEGSSISNLDVHDPQANPLDDYIADLDPSMKFGHRNWVLHQSLTNTAFGAARGANSIYSTMVVTKLVKRVDNAPMRDPFVAWPPAGFVPTPVVPKYWNVTAPGGDFASAKVTVNGSLRPTVYATSPQTAAGLVAQVAWEMPAAAAGQTYEVKISDVKLNGVATTLQYTVSPFAVEQGAFISSVNSWTGIKAGTNQAVIYFMIKKLGANATVIINNTHNLELVAGAGGTDNDKFTIVKDVNQPPTLVSKAAMNPTSLQYTVRLKFTVDGQSEERIVQVPNTPAQ